MRNLKYSNYNDNYRGSDPYSSPQNAYNQAFELDEIESQSNFKRNICRNFLFLLPLIAFILICFFSVCLLITSKDNNHLDFKEQTAVLNYLGKNYKKDLWEECKAVPKSENCATGLKHEPIGTFKGLKEGCLCKDGTVHTKAFCQTKSESKCKWFPGHAGKDYLLWKTRKFCVKKIDSWKILNKGEVCSGTGMKKCGNYCVKSTKCPITKIQLLPRQPTTFIQEATSFVERSNFDVNKDIVITRGTNEKGVVNIDAKLSGFPCAADGLKNPQSKSGKFYPLQKVPTNGCGKYGTLEANSEHLDRHLDKLFLTENGIWSSVDNAPYIEEFRNSKDYFNLVSIHKIATKNEKVCYDVDGNQSKRIEHGFKKLHETLYGLLIALIVISAIGIIISILFLLLRKNLKFLNTRGAVFLMFLLLLIFAPSVPGTYMVCS